MTQRQQPGCTGKKKYRTAAEADAMLGLIWSLCKPGRRLESRYYPCDHCGQWHLTSMPLAQAETEHAA
ncbi:hypothetical protein VA596_50070 [Amycolatopsis sp., V23-08]|uniref:Transposase n=1 Tax=Amycolatopsis heterodermiae TaxID=3110235 RepID=A0ABU5RPI8_9PSEU|nr:hypothetical protein [Amycolatopsis sp., V23-08]MEA5367759.1 hypothetical protein [Amycolatopsis sp., V23-08]